MTTNLAQARAQLGAVLKTALGSKYSYFPDASKSIQGPLAKPTLLIERASFEDFKASPLTHRESKFNLYVIAPANANDDALEGYAEEVSRALETNTDIAGIEGTRGRWPADVPTNPCYVLTFTRLSPKE
jgi:hypothetical protein